MKNYKDVRKIISSWIDKEVAASGMPRDTIVDVIHQAWLMETLCYCANLSETAAATLVDRYILLCDELGCPLMITEAAGALLSLLEDRTVYSVETIASMPLERLKVLLASEADKFFTYGLEGDSTIAAALGLNG